MMTLIVWCFASAGSRVSLTGGPYPHVGKAVGPVFGFFSGGLFFLSASMAVAGVASVFVASLAAIWPPAGNPAVRAAVLVLLFAGLAAVNVRGVTPGARLVEAMTLAKLIPLGVLIIAGVWFVRPEHLAVSVLPT